MIKEVFCLCCVLAVAGILSGCVSSESTRDIPAVTDFHLDKYLGTWYEIARLPHSFERDMDQVSAEYSLASDGIVKVINRGVRNGESKAAQAVAKFKSSPDIGELRVSFFRPFYGDYRIIELADDYSSAIVTSSSKKYLWILARQKSLSPALQELYFNKIRAWGFAVDKLEYPKHDEK
ncbi:MAG: lipocalin family protein [Lentisphaeria bacterium]